MSSNITDHIKSFAAKQILLIIESESEMVCTVRYNRGI